MGLLDDAIRQHLELKKRSGAPEDEIDRLENEAFGAARRAADVPREPAPVEDLPPEEPAAVAAEPPPVPVEPAPPEPEPEPELEPEPEPEAVAPPEPVEPVAARRAPVVDDEPWLEEPDEVPVVEAGGEPVSDYVAPDEEGEDLLEETPDFLQETPEHDRLWFEQKPPRDFDFNE